jgi:hypothetical protein
MTSLPGHPITDDELCCLGFSAHDMVIRATGIVLPDGVGCEWTTLGDIADSPGLYAFTVDDGAIQHVTYVGLTTHLWMVTKGCLPRSGGARPGQRYGRPKYSGITRQRVNVLIAAQLDAGRRVRHWLRPLDAGHLRREEEALIQRWRLRELGWNRG